MELKFFEGFSKNTHISNFMKNRSVGAELFRAVRQTQRERDRHDEANSRFSQLCERAPPQKEATSFCHHIIMRFVQLLRAD